MSLRQLPEIKAFQRPAHLDHMPPSPDALARWDTGVRAAGESDNNVIDILDVIGVDPWTGDGVTLKRISGALRAIGSRDVIVNINSPGGDLFEGIGIYNALRAHPHKITVRVLALAASAASIIAMAGDDIQVARTGFVMVHNGWVLAVGNRHDMREIADWLEPFDAVIADTYRIRTGLDLKEIQKLMDAESWIGGKDAVDKGFADGFLAADQVKEDSHARANARDVLAVRRVDAILAQQGIPRTERRSLIAGVKTGMPSAAESATHDAGALLASIHKTISTLKS